MIVPDPAAGGWPMTGSEHRSLVSFAMGTIAVLLVLGPLFIGGSRATGDVACAGPDVRVHADLFMVYQSAPALAVGPDGTIYSVWIDNRGGPSAVYFASSTDGGATWTDPSVRVSPVSAGHQGEPAIAVDGSGTLYVVYRGGVSSTIDVWVTKSADGGLTWGVPSKVNDVSGFVQVSQSYGPAIVLAPNGVAYVAFEDWRNGDPDIYASSSTDGGATWSANVRVNDDAPGIEQRGDPALAVDATGVVYVAWQDWRNDPQDPDVYVSTSGDGGLTWTPNFAVNDVAAGWQADPVLASDAAGVYAAWSDNREATRSGAIYFSRSMDGGLSWTASIRLSEHGENWQAPTPTMVVGPAGLFVAWTYAKPNVGWPDILLVPSVDGGATWGANVWVTDHDRSQLDASVAFGGDGQVYVAWVDERNNYVDPDSGVETGNPDIYFAACEVTGLPQAASRPITVNPVEVLLGDGTPPVGEECTTEGDGASSSATPSHGWGRGCRLDEGSTTQGGSWDPQVETHRETPTTSVITVPTARVEGCPLSGAPALAVLGLLLGVGVWGRRSHSER